jgi:putative flavoprotein involved in K+ transport
MSRHLTERGIDHVVLERGEVANSWRTQRWDSLRLLTPNWMTRLPGFGYTGPDPDGYQSATDVVALLARYAADAPVITRTAVTLVCPTDDGFAVSTEDGEWRTRSVVLAGGTTSAALPLAAAHLPADILSVTALEYRNPTQLPDGGVLVVGASATGMQIAEEVHRSGRPVTLAVGEHVRMQRRYRDRDILWWLDATAILDQRYTEMDDLVRARNLPSMQLIGADRTLDLNALRTLGVRLVGRLAAVRNGVAQFSGSLANVCALADLKLSRLLTTIDAYAGGRGERPAPTIVPKAPLEVDLASGEIRSVVWATGVQPDFSWLDAPVFDHRGRLRHDGGVTPWPGLYAMGLPLLRRRRSTFIDGARFDAGELADQLAGHVGALVRSA